MTISIINLTDPEELGPLAQDAVRHGHRMVRRLCDEWRDGRNRFDRLGEILLVARDAQQRVVGVCGLNRDPYADQPQTGRVRRLYVASDQRRQGIGQHLVAAIQQHGAGVFDVLNLRTHDPDAAAFYVAQGFTPVESDPYCTHRRDLKSDVRPRPERRS